MPSPLEHYRSQMLPALEQALQQALKPWEDHPARLLAEMVTHHFGWQDPQARAGKRVRPLLLLLVHEAAGGSWRQALPAAVAVELIHNFSLIHDDIQDRSRTRRGRPTVWARWNVAQAINAGDALFAQAFGVLHALGDPFGPERALEAVHHLAQACIVLVQGQVLDLQFETQEQVSLEAYLTMIEGKTAALLAAAARVGALLAGAPEHQQQGFEAFGRYLGLAFQMWDDYLGVWGDPRHTGKSTADDLVAGKKTLPVLYGLQDPDSPFARRWRQGAVTEEEAPRLAQWLAEQGAREYVRAQAQGYTRQALQALDAAGPREPAGQALRELADALLGRRG